jgi:predicted metal-dependent hydrolase
MSMREIQLLQKKIRYTIKKRRYQRRINFIVHQDGTLIVTAPQSCSIGYIEDMLFKNGSWIIEQISDRQKSITIDPRVVKHIKKAIRPIILFKIEEFNRYYNFTFNRVSIRYQRSRWGSCSTDGNLNFNCKLLCLRGELRDYVIVHELCHLKEMNHSQNFWQLVSETIPHYKELRKELKDAIV